MKRSVKQLIEKYERFVKIAEYEVGMYQKYGGQNKSEKTENETKATCYQRIVDDLKSITDPEVI